MKPTQETYEPLQKCYDHFNTELFGGELTQCMIVLHRKRGVAGYYWPNQFQAIDGKSAIDEISLNPSYLDRPERVVLSTLVHEMVHLWQFHFGKPSRRGYHNAEWANKMETVGLMPSNTGKPNGKRTGHRLTHYIIQGGAFDVACSSLPERGFLKWSASKQVKRERRPNARAKYTCPQCGLNAWAKPKIRLSCFDCVAELEAV